MTIKMPELDRAAYYSPEELDVEYVPWDCDNVSGDGEVSDDDENAFQVP